MHRLLLWPSLLAVSCFTSSLSAADLDTANLAVRVQEMREANWNLLLDYRWRRTTEVAFDGITILRSERISFDEQGDLVRKEVAAAESLGSDEQRARAQEHARRFEELVDRYTSWSSAKLLEFFANARFQPGEAPFAHTIHITGRDVMAKGDEVELWLDAESLHPFRAIFSAQLEGAPVTGDVSFARVPDGPFYISRTEVRLDGRRVVGSVVQSEMENPEAVVAEALAESGWPRIFEKDGAKLAIYEPQVESWKRRRRLEAIAAIGIEESGDAELQFGVARIEAVTAVDTELRIVTVRRIKIVEIVLPDIEDEKRREKIDKKVRRLFPKGPLPFALERFLAAAEEVDDDSRETEILFDAPEIIVSEVRSVLVAVEGAPIYDAIDGTDLELVLNTEWDLFRHSNGQHYLRIETSWQSAPTLDGPWQPVTGLPADFSRLPDHPRWKETRAAMPPRNLEQPVVVFVRTVPAELVVTTGKPDFVPIPETKLMDVRNTESDLFLDLDERRFYLLLSGRWFDATQLSGPWSYAGDDLPDTLTLIPSDHPRAHVLASIPGTPEADEAVLLSQIPRTATVERHSPEVEVDYYGDPEFEDISDIGVARATNTTDEVFQVDGRFYLCRDGVWFESDNAAGPWKPCVEVPETIYDIPVDSPSHRVTYVRVYDYDDDEVVYGYTGGYLGYYGYGGVLYYGCYPYYARAYGYYYNCHYRRRPSSHPYWRGRCHHFPHAQPYGRGARYDGRVGHYRYNRYPSSWARRSNTTSHRGVYGGWRRGVGVTRTHGAVRGSASRTPAGMKRTGRNVYAGRDGKVYRKHNGKWQQRRGSRWNNVENPGARGSRGRANRTSVKKGLDRHAKSRKSGQRRVTKRKKYHRGGTIRRGGYRGGTIRRGGYRGGSRGGMRGGMRGRRG